MQRIRTVRILAFAALGVKHAIYLRGFPNAPISGVRISNCTFNNAAEPNVMENVQGLKLTAVKRNGELLTAGN